MTFKTPERYRIGTGRYGTTEANGCNGAFWIPVHSTLKGGPPLRVIASDGEYWEHVSVSLPNRCPTWVEMCHVKELFWDDEDVVMQLHPARSDYVNYHPHCLHLWRPANGQQIPLPPVIMVGLPGLTEPAP